jgi:hypothetical protein
MASEAVETFARLLIQEVRDEAIRASDSRFENRGSHGQRWREVVAGMGPREAVLELIPDIVDETVRALIVAIEEGPLHMYFAPEGGEPQDLEVVGRGEMLGCYADEEEWITRYSHERFYPYVAQPRLSDQFPPPRPEDLR